MFLSFIFSCMVVCAFLVPFEVFAMQSIAPQDPNSYRDEYMKGYLSRQREQPLPPFCQGWVDRENLKTPQIGVSE